MIVDTQWGAQMFLNSCRPYTRLRQSARAGGKQQLSLLYSLGLTKK